MRISQIGASNFLSFDRLALSDLNPRLNVIVGPNGAGKTNLIRLLAMVRDALDPRSRVTWEPLAVRPERGAGWIADIAFEFTGEWEKQLFTTFFHASLATHLDVPPEIAEAYEEWTSDISAPTISSMFSGVLRVSCSHGPAPHWTITYGFEHDGVQYEWLLDGGPMQGIRRAGQDSDAPFQGGPLLMNLLRTGMEPEALMEVLRIFSSRSIGAEDILPGQRQLVQPAVRSRPMGPLPQPLNWFGQLTGLPIAGTPSEYGGVHLFQALFSRSLALTSDIRVPTRDQYGIDDLSRAPESSNVTDGSDVVLYLFLLKNGSPAGRARYSSIQSIFFDLTGARFDVGLEPRMSGSPEPSGQVRLLVTVDRQGNNVPLAFAGAGFRESLFLSVHIAGPDQHFLCLDEPALNLHPSLQRKVVRMLTQREGQTFLITHSPYMLTVHGETDLTRIIRFHMSEGNTRVARLRLEDHPELDRQRWLKEIWRSVDSPALLFGRGVVLVEGETEAAALPLWFAKSRTAGRHGTPEDNNILIYSVGGAQNLAIYSGFLRAFSLPAAIVCDSDQFSNAAFLRQLGLEARRSDQSIEQFRAAAEGRGIFTLCDGDDQEFECLPYVRPLLERAEGEVGSSPVRRGRYIAETTECPPEVDALYEKLLKCLLPS